MTGQKDFIPFNGITRQYRNLEYELRHEIDIVMSSGDLLNGHKKNLFEDQIASRIGREYAICINSGTNALHYIFDWLQSQQGTSTKPIWHDNERWPIHPRIAVPNFSFKATQNSIAERGQARFIDVDPQTGLMDFQSESFQCKLDIIMYVNLFGNMINYEELITINKMFYDNKDSIIIEDAAQSFGAKFKGKPSGSFGDFSIFSFDPTKNFGSSTGGGGMILTDNHFAAGWFFSYLSNGITNQNTGMPAVNSNMSEINCAGMLIKLKYFDEWQRRRTEIAEYYNNNLHKSIITPRYTTTEFVEHAYSKYVILSDKRDTIKDKLKQADIETKIHYEFNEAWTMINQETSSSRTLSKIVLSLPIYPELTDTEVERIVYEVNKSVA